jgi:hypothetical protein
MNIKPIPAILILLVFLALAALAAQSSMQAASIQGPSDLSKDGLGNLHVRINQKVFVYDSEGDYRRDYSLTDFGLRDIWGGLSFYSNQDLLLAPAEATSDGNNKARARPPLTNGILYRCDGGTFQCSPLTGFSERLSRSYRASIDEQGWIYLSNSATGEVSLLDDKGTLIEALPHRLSRPTEIQRHKNTLVVADSGGHSLLVIPLEGRGFSAEAEWRRISTRPPRNDSWKVSQPVDFTGTDTGWAVLVKNADMSRSSVRHYSEAGDFEMEFKLQRNGYIIALESLGDELVATDYRNWQVLRFDQSGSDLGQLSSPQQERYIEELRAEIRQHEIMSLAAWMVFGILVVAGFVIAIRAELRKASQNKTSASASAARRAAGTPKPSHRDPNIKWLGRPRFDIASILMLLIALISVSLLVLPSILPTLDKATNSPTVLGLVALAFFVSLVPLNILRKRIKNTHIGVRDEWVIVCFHDGTKETSRDEDLLVFGNGFIIGKRKVSIGNEKNYLYSKSDIQSLLEPLLANGKKLSIGEAAAWEWQNNRTSNVVALAVIILCLVLAIAAEY